MILCHNALVRSANQSERQKMSGQSALGAVESLDVEHEGVYTPPRRSYEELTQTPLRDDGSKKRARRRHRVTRSRNRRRRRIVKEAQRKFGRYHELLKIKDVQFDEVKSLLNRMFHDYNASVGKDDSRIAYKIYNFLIKYDLIE